MKLRFYYKENCGNSCKVVFTDMMLRLIDENRHHLTNAQLAEALGIRLTVLRTKMYEMGWKRMECEHWSHEETAFLINNYREMGDNEISDILNVVSPKNKKWTSKHIDKKRGYLGLRRTEEDLQRIHDRNRENGAWKICPVKMWKARGVTPVGAVKIWCDQRTGRKYKVIKTEKGFVHYAPWLWEQLHGPVPEGYVVTFKDLNNMNVVAENLELLTRAEFASRNKHYPAELRETIKLINQLTFTLKQKQNEKTA